MTLGIDTVKDAIEVAFICIGGIAIIFAGFTYVLNKKQHYFVVINNCMNKFQENFIVDNEFTDQHRKYLDLVNEELFYIENKYVPIDIAAEWIDGILDYLPVLLNGNIQSHPNPDTPFGRDLSKLELALFPRIRKALMLNLNEIPENLIDKENVQVRMKIILQIVENIFSKRFYLNRKISKLQAYMFLTRTYGC